MTDVTILTVAINLYWFWTINCQDIETIPPNFTLKPSSNDSEQFSQEIGTLSTPKSTTSTVAENLDISESDKWIKEAVKDIAYYLRAHKFNEYDRRYNRNGTNAERTNFQYFPRPLLRSLHWEVQRYCQLSFLHCADYLRKKLRQVALRRQDDTSVAAQENGFAFNSSQLRQIDEECRKMRKIDDLIAEPFEGPLERYQWRTTAAYYMCWYAMNEIPDLEHLNESCDNFAYCLDESFGPNNKDVRAKDEERFACALYSFCPDPCCPSKHLDRQESCRDDPKNPCFENGGECALNRAENKEFSDLILNRWNVTCQCKERGYVWSSFYGICVDKDECENSREKMCKNDGEACLNAPGSFNCVCKWGFYFDERKNKCVKSEAIAKIKLNSESKIEAEKSPRDRYKMFIRAVLRIIGPPAVSGCVKLNSRFFSFKICILNLLLRI